MIRKNLPFMNNYLQRFYQTIKLFTKLYQTYYKTIYKVLSNLKTKFNYRQYGLHFYLSNQICLQNTEKLIYNIRWHAMNKFVPFLLYQRGKKSLETLSINNYYAKC